MTKAKAIKEFLSRWAEARRAHRYHNMSRTEAWDKYLVDLCRSGEITSKQYEQWFDAMPQSDL